MKKKTTKNKKTSATTKPEVITVTSDKESEIIKHEYGTETEYKGIVFRSKFEATIAKHLDDLGLRWEYETMSLPYMPKVSMYTPDFKVWRPSGDDRDWFLIETKGYFDARARQKMMQIRRQYPDYDIKMLFQKPNLLVGGTKKMTYTDWSKKYDYDVLTVAGLEQLARSNGVEINAPSSESPVVPTKPKRQQQKKKAKPKEKEQHAV